MAFLLADFARDGQAQSHCILGSVQRLPPLLIGCPNGATGATHRLGGPPSPTDDGAHSAMEFLENVSRHKRQFAALIGVSLALSGLLGLTDWGRAAVRTCHDWLYTQVGDETLVNYLRQRVDDLKGQLHEHCQAHGRVADRMARLEGDVRQKQVELSRHRDLLERARAALERPGDTVAVAGQSIPRSSVESDARSRLTRCRQLDREVAALQPVLEQHREALRTLEANVGQLRALRDEAEAEIQTAQVKLKATESNKQVAEITAAVRTRFAPDDRYARALDELNRRTTEAQVTADYLNDAGRSPTVNWDGPAELRKELTTYLGRPGVVAERGGGH